MKAAMIFQGWTSSCHDQRDLSMVDNLMPMLAVDGLLLPCKVGHFTWTPRAVHWQARKLAVQTQD